MLNTIHSLSSYSKRSPVYIALERFFSFYLIEHNLKKAISCVSQNIFSIGTGEGEVAIGIEQFSSLLQFEIASLPSSISFETYNYTECPNSSGSWNCFCNMHLTLLVEENLPVVYTTRLTAILHLEDGQYIIDALHMSEINCHQEDGEFFPIQFVSEETNHLDRTTQNDLLQIIDQMMPGGVIWRILGGRLSVICCERASASNGRLHL